MPDYLKMLGIDLDKSLSGIEELEKEERQKVVLEALTWVGTPYRIGADVKGSGIDCGMLLLRVFVDTGLFEPFDPRPYPEQWHLHQQEERYLDYANHFGEEVPAPPERRCLPADVVMFKYGKCFAHGAIVVADDYIIHSNRPVPCGLDKITNSFKLNKMEKKYFSYWPRRERNPRKPAGSVE